MFVINVRPGWLRVDVYGSDGKLEAILTEPDPGFNKSFYPTDIGIRFEDGEYLIAVTIAKPRPSVRLYAWQPPTESRGVHEHGSAANKIDGQ